MRAWLRVVVMDAYRSKGHTKGDATTADKGSLESNY